MFSEYNLLRKYKVYVCPSLVLKRTALKSLFILKKNTYTKTMYGISICETFLRSITLWVGGIRRPRLIKAGMARIFNMYASAFYRELKINYVYWYLNVWYQSCKRCHLSHTYKEICTVVEATKKNEKIIRNSLSYLVLKILKCVCSNMLQF